MSKDCGERNEEKSAQKRDLEKAQEYLTVSEDCEEQNEEKSAQKRDLERAEHPENHDSERHEDPWNKGRSVPKTWGRVGHHQKVIA